MTSRLPFSPLFNLKYDKFYVMSLIVNPHYTSSLFNIKIYYRLFNYLHSIIFKFFSVIICLYLLNFLSNFHVLSLLIWKFPHKHYESVKVMEKLSKQKWKKNKFKCGNFHNKSFNTACNKRNDNYPKKRNHLWCKMFLLCLWISRH